MEREELQTYRTSCYTSLSSLYPYYPFATSYQVSCIELQLYNIPGEKSDNTAYDTVEHPKEISVWDPQTYPRLEITLVCN